MRPNTDNIPMANPGEPIRFSITNSQTLPTEDLMLLTYDEDKYLNDTNDSLPVIPIEEIDQILNTTNRVPESISSIARHGFADPIVGISELPEPVVNTNIAMKQSPAHGKHLDADSNVETVVTAPAPAIPMKKQRYGKRLPTNLRVHDDNTPKLSIGKRLANESDEDDDDDESDKERVAKKKRVSVSSKKRRRAKSESTSGSDSDDSDSRKTKSKKGRKSQSKSKKAKLAAAASSSSGSSSSSSGSSSSSSGSSSSSSDSESVPMPLPNVATRKLPVASKQPKSEHSLNISYRPSGMIAHKSGSGDGTTYRSALPNQQLPEYHKEQGSRRLGKKNRIDSVRSNDAAVSAASDEDNERRLRPAKRELPPSPALPEMNTAEFDVFFQNFDAVAISKSDIGKISYRRQPFAYPYVTTSVKLMDIPTVTINTLAVDNVKITSSDEVTYKSPELVGLQTILANHGIALTTVSKCDYGKALRMYSKLPSGVELYTVNNYKLIYAAVPKHMEPFVVYWSRLVLSNCSLNKHVAEGDLEECSRIYYTLSSTDTLDYKFDVNRQKAIDLIKIALKYLPKELANKILDLVVDPIFPKYVSLEAALFIKSVYPKVTTELKDNSLLLLWSNIMQLLGLHHYTCNHTHAEIIKNLKDKQYLVGRVDDMVNSNVTHSFDFNYFKSRVASKFTGVHLHLSKQKHVKALGNHLCTVYSVFCKLFARYLKSTGICLESPTVNTAHVIGFFNRPELQNLCHAANFGVALERCKDLTIKQLIAKNYKALDTKYKMKLKTSAALQFIDSVNLIIVSAINVVLMSAIQPEFYAEYFVKALKDLMKRPVFVNCRNMDMWSMYEDEQDTDEEFNDLDYKSDSESSECTTSDDESTDDSDDEDMVEEDVDDLKSTGTCDLYTSVAIQNVETVYNKPASSTSGLVAADSKMTTKKVHGNNKKQKMETSVVSSECLSYKTTGQVFANSGVIRGDGATPRYKFNPEIMSENYTLVPNFTFPVGCKSSRNVCMSIEEFETQIEDGSVRRQTNNRYESISANTLNSYINNSMCPSYLYKLNLVSPGDKADKRLACILCSTVKNKRSTIKRMNIYTCNGVIADIPACVLCQVRLGEDFYNRVYRFDHNAIVNRIVDKKLHGKKNAKPLVFDDIDGNFVDDATFA